MRFFPDGLTDVISDLALESDLWPTDGFTHRILLFGCYVIDYKWMVLPLAREPG